MTYLGGKSRLAKTVARYLESVRRPGQAYLEPFVGGANVVARMSGERYASDVHEPLITMWRALQNGWVPPDVVTREQHAWYNKHRPADDPMTAFVGFGCSFGGIYFKGYAHNNHGYNYAAAAKASCLRKIATMQDVSFRCCSYAHWQPVDTLIYCDPPYAGTTLYKSVERFDHALFWQTMRDWSERNTVIISEYAAPADFRCVAKMPTKLCLRSVNGSEPRTERLFCYDP